MSEGLDPRIAAVNFAIASVRPDAAMPVEYLVSSLSSVASVHGIPVGDFANGVADWLKLTPPPSNQPKVDLAAALDLSVLAPWVEYQYAEHAARNAELLASHTRFLVVTEAGIADDEVAGRAADFANQLRAEVTATDATRMKIKSPVLHAQRLIDGSAKALNDRLTAAGAVVQARITTYLRAKETAAREAAEREAARLAAEAEARIVEANETHTPEAHEAAVEAFGAAREAEQQATARGLDLTRTRSQSGSLTALKDNWVYRVVSLDAVPAAYLTINDAVVKAAIRSGTRSIPGLEIINDAKAFVR